MNQNELIQQLSADLKPVKLQKSFAWRFNTLMFACCFVAALGVYYWYIKKAEFHIPEGRSLLEGILLLLTFVISTHLGTNAATPLLSQPLSSKKPMLFLGAWVVTLGSAFLFGFLENKEEALVALQYNTWLCPTVVFSIAVPSFIVSLLYFFKGSVLYSFQAFFYSSALAMSLGALGLSFICPWADPLHEILWHVLPVFAAITIASYAFHGVFKFIKKESSIF